MKIWCVKHIDYGRHTAVKGIQVMSGVLAYCESSKVNRVVFPFHSISFNKI